MFVNANHILKLQGLADRLWDTLCMLPAHLSMKILTLIYGVFNRNVAELLVNLTIFSLVSFQVMWESKSLKQTLLGNRPMTTARPTTHACFGLRVSKIRTLSYSGWITPRETVDSGSVWGRVVSSDSGFGQTTGWWATATGRITTHSPSCPCPTTAVSSLQGTTTLGAMRTVCFRCIFFVRRRFT